MFNAALTAVALLLGIGIFFAFWKGKSVTNFTIGIIATISMILLSFVSNENHVFVARNLTVLVGLGLCGLVAFTVMREYRKDNSVPKKYPEKPIALCIALVCTLVLLQLLFMLHVANSGITSL